MIPSLVSYSVIKTHSAVSRNIQRAVNVLKACPHLRDAMPAFIKRQGLPPHPVAEAMGPRWSVKRGVVLHGSKKVGGACIYCGKGKDVGNSVKIFMCSRCRYTRYW